MSRETSPKFEAKASGDTLELLMYGYVGTDYWGDGSAIDAVAVAKTLQQHKSAKLIHLQVSSGGGDLFHALAMYSALKSHGAKVKATIHGLCGSAMTVIVCSADEIEMSEAGLYMIHEAQWGTYGTAAEQESILEATQKCNEMSAAIYAARTGKTAAECRKMMADVTWMTANEAKDNGFITSVSALKTMSAEFRPDQFSNVPERIKPLLAKLQTEGTPTMTQPTPTPVPTPAPAASAAPATPVATAAAVAPLAPATPVTPAVDPVAAATQRCSQITSACMLAGKGELASKYIDDPAQSIDTVRGALLTMVCNERQPSDAGNGGGQQQPANPNAKYEAEFEANKTLYAEMSLTKEAYVRGRRIDDGLESLPMKTRV